MARRGDGPYHFIGADPPWSYRVWSKPTSLLKRDGSRSDGKRVASAHYQTLSMDALAALPIDELAAPDCALGL